MLPLCAGLRAQQDQLTRVHAVVWSALEEDAEIEQAWASDGLADMRAVATRLAPPGAEQEQLPEPSILRSSHAHDNNRLGVNNREKPISPTS